MSARTFKLLGQAIPLTEIPEPVGAVAVQMLLRSLGHTVSDKLALAIWVNADEIARVKIMECAAQQHLVECGYWQ